jgi:hypothetical protein
VLVLERRKEYSYGNIYKQEGQPDNHIEEPSHISTYRVHEPRPSSFVHLHFIFSLAHAVHARVLSLPVRGIGPPETVMAVCSPGPDTGMEPLFSTRVPGRLDILVHMPEDTERPNRLWCATGSECEHTGKRAVM